MKKLICAFILVCTPLAFGKKPSLKELNHTLQSQSSKVIKIAAQIKHLDKQLTKTNNNYLEKVKVIEALEKKVNLMKSDLKKTASRISKDYNRSKKALNLYLLEAIDDENEDQILHRKVYLEILNKKLKKLGRAQTSSNKLLENINLYEQKLSQTKATEESIYYLIVDLENKKKEMSQSYITELESKNVTEAKLDKMRAKKRAYKKVYKKQVTKYKKKSFYIDLPLTQFVNLKKSKKGLTFNFKETTPIKAPYSGKIVYSGELASYGNVLIVDHGSDVRSVILGDMKIKVNKGDLVQKAQVLGYTLADPGIVKSLYYEIRKKNIAQNTSEWLSKSNKNSLKI